jgi:L-asparaginase
MRTPGQVVLVGSTAGQRGEAFHADYAASKGAMISFVKSLCIECAPGITVNCVAPGWVDTEMSWPAFGDGGRERIAATIPLRRIASAEDVAGPILFLLSDLGRHITGEVLNVNGGSVSRVDDPPDLHRRHDHAPRRPGWRQRPGAGGDDLVRLAPGLAALAPFVVDDWARQPACHMSQERHWALRNHVREVAARGDGVTGIVVTHGTDTLEETAYLLDRTIGAGIPIAVTGAMLTSSDAGWDGPRNLTDATRVVAAPESRGRGTMVVFAGSVFQQASAATDPDAFGAPHGSLWAVDGDVVRYTTPAGRADPVLPARLDARVALVPMVVGDEGGLLELARPAHDGVVVVGFGSGNIPPGALPAVRRWIAEGKPVVLASRCAEGQVTPVYAFEGGGATLVREGVIPAGPRTPSQARMELTIALSAGTRYAAGCAA